MKLISKKALVGTLAAFVFAFVAVLSPINVTSVSAQSTTPTCDENAGASGGIGCARGEGTPDQLFGEGSIFTTIVNVLLFIIGAISVIMLVWGGIRYTTSGGNSSSVTAAKNTIMYAIIGLIVAFLAFAIVNWVLGAVTPQA